MSLISKYKTKSQIFGTHYDSTPYWIITAIPTLNRAVDPERGRGIPGGQILQLTGDSGSGKTVVLSSLIASVQGLGGIPIFYDPEETANSPFMGIFGVDTNNLIIGNRKDIKPKKKGETPKLSEIGWTMEDTIDDIVSKSVQHYEALEDYKKKNKGKVVWGPESEGKFPPLVFFLDSVESTPSRFQLALQEQFGSDPERLDRALAGNNVRNNKSKMLKDKLQVIQSLIARAGCTFIMTNQIFMKPGVMYGKDTQEGGGKGLRFHTNVIIELTQKQKLYGPDGLPYKEITGDNKGKVTGVEVQAYTEKNKVGPPFRKAFFDVIFDKGISVDRHLFDVGVDLGFIVPAEDATGKIRKGKFIYTKDKTKKVFSKKTFPAYLETHPKMKARLT